MDVTGKIRCLLVLSIALSTQVALGARCPAMESEEFARYVVSSGAKRVIFFASWCISCREHLQSAGKEDIIVGVFDEANRIERLAEKLKTDAPCVQGDGIAKSYGVTSLPASRPIQRLQSQRH